MPVGSSNQRSGTVVGIGGCEHDAGWQLGPRQDAVKVPGNAAFGRGRSGRLAPSPVGGEAIDHGGDHGVER